MLLLPDFVESGLRGLDKGTKSLHNNLDALREKSRSMKANRISQSGTNTHRPVGHMRQRGHMDNISQRAGGDERQRVLNNNNIARRKRDNDRIIIDRPLG